jgi:hypothetical protein
MRYPREWLGANAADGAIGAPHLASGAVARSDLMRWRAATSGGALVALRHRGEERAPPDVRGSGARFALAVT